MIGKYNPGHGVCYVSEDSRERAVRDFLVLVAYHGSQVSAAVSAVKAGGISRIKTENELFLDHFS